MSCGTFSLMVVLALAACDSGAGGGDPGDVGDADVDADSDGDTDSDEVGCPEAPPPSGSECAQSELFCEWGDDPRVGWCRPRASCNFDPYDPPPRWFTSRNECEEIPEGDCPAEPTAEGACPTDGLICVYPDGAICGCCGAHCDQDPVWGCTPAPDPGCPEIVPNQGRTCTLDESVQCFYGSCETGTGAYLVSCDASRAWTLSAQLCP